jgi:hypothetical protein
MGLKLAHFPAVKELQGFDFEAQPSIDPKQIRDLAASRWIANHSGCARSRSPAVRSMPHGKPIDRCRTR